MPEAGQPSRGPLPYQRSIQNGEELGPEIPRLRPSSRFVSLIPSISTLDRSPHYGSPNPIRSKPGEADLPARDACRRFWIALFYRRLRKKVRPAR